MVVSVLTSPQQLKETKGVSQKELIELMTVVDDDNSGTIRYREFVNLMLILDGNPHSPPRVAMRHNLFMQSCFKAFSRNQSKNRISTLEWPLDEHR